MPVRESLSKQGQGAALRARPGQKQQQSSKTCSWLVAETSTAGSKQGLLQGPISQSSAAPMKRQISGGAHGASKGDFFSSPLKALLFSYFEPSHCTSTYAVGHSVFKHKKGLCLTHLITLPKLLNNTFLHCLPPLFVPSVPAPGHLEVSIKQLGRSQSGASFKDIQNILLWSAKL